MRMSRCFWRTTESYVGGAAVGWQLISPFVHWFNPESHTCSRSRGSQLVMSCKALLPAARGETAATHCWLQQRWHFSTQALIAAESSAWHGRGATIN